jgi:hypothetical protein
MNLIQRDSVAIDARAAFLVATVRKIAAAAASLIRIEADRAFGLDLGQPLVP